MSYIKAVAQYLHRRVEMGKGDVDQIFIGNQQTGLIYLCTLYIGLE